MDYNVVANLAGNLGNFSKTFKSYISRCDKSNRVISTAEEKMATYADMTLMDYYVDKHMEEFLTNPLLATKDEKQREAWIELERKHAEQKFEAISAAERANIETEYEALRDEALSVKNHAKIAIEQEKILREKESLYQAIDEVREKNAESRELIEAEIVALQNRDIRVLEQNIKDLNRQLIEAAKKANSAEVAELEAVYGDKIKKVEEQIAAVNEKVAFYNNVLELLDAFESELTDVSVRNENIAELFKVNFEESNDVFKIISDGLAKLNEENVKSDENVDVIIEDTKAIAAKVETRKGKDFVFDLVKNVDGSFNIVMRKAGFKSSVKQVEAGELTAEFINKKLADFATTVAAETTFTKTQILNGEVIIRFNGLVIGLDDKVKNGKYNVAEVPAIVGAAMAMPILGAGEPEVIEEVEPELAEEVPAEEITPEEVVAEAVVTEEVTPEEVVVEEVVAEEVTPEEVVEEVVAEEVAPEEVVAEEVVAEEVAPEEVVEEVVAEEVTPEEVVEEVVAEEVTPEEVVVEEVTPEEVTPVEVAAEEEMDETPVLTEEEIVSVETPHVPTKAEKMAKVLKSRETKFGKTRDIAILAGAGLFGASLFGAATLPLAAVAAGVSVMASGLDIMQQLRVFVGRKSTYRKLNKLAAKFDATVKYDFDTNKVRFVAVDDLKNEHVIDRHDLSTIEATYGVDVQEELDRIFKNKVRSVSNPRTIKELDYKDFPKVSVDNLEAAYDEFGGLMAPEAEQSFAYRMFNGTRGVKPGEPEEEEIMDAEIEEVEEVEEAKPTFGERMSGFFGRFGKKDSAEEEEVELEETPVVEEVTPAPVVEEEQEEVVAAPAEEEEFVVFGEAFDDLDELDAAPVIDLDEMVVEEENTKKFTL